MSLYPKKLKSLKDLEKEKKFLLKEVERMDKDDTLSPGGLMGKKGKKSKDSDDDDEGGFNISSLVSMLPINSPVTMGLVELVTDRIINRKDSGKEDRKDSSKEERYAAATKPKKKSHAIRNAVIEVLGGYLKWKATELAYKGVKHLVKKRREKKMAEKICAEFTPNEK